MHEVDFEAEGFLEGLDSEEAREARRQLVRDLLDADVSLDELREAAAQNRLATLPLELAYTRDCKHTLRQALDELGFSEEFMRRNYLALGVPQPELDEPAISDEDMEAWRTIKLLFDSGVDEDTVIALGRMSGRTAAQTAEALIETFTQLYARPGDTERDFGLRMADVAKRLEPALAPMMTTPVRLHLRQLVRHEAVVQVERATGELPDTRDVTVCFADLVDFTSLTERVESLELGEVTERLETLSAECAEPPVRLVKLIGDAAMFVCPDPETLVETTGALLERADADDRLPQLRAGIAAGQALQRAGDWYGHPVNLAARIAAVAEPGTVFGDRAVAERTGDRFDWDEREAQRLKGIADDVELFRLATAKQG
jgi:adenylate cyclase